MCATVFPFSPQWMKFLRGGRLTYFIVCCSHNTPEIGMKYETNNSFPVSVVCVHLLHSIETQTLLFYSSCFIVTLTHYAADTSPGSVGTLRFLWVINLLIVFFRQGGLLNLDFVVIAAASGPLLTFDLNKTHLAKGDFDWQPHYKKDSPPGFHHLLFQFLRRWWETKYSRPRQSRCERQEYTFIR